MNTPRSIIGAAFVAFCATDPLQAQCGYLPQLDLEASSQGVAYGQALGLDGDSLAVSDSKANAIGLESGIVYLYNYDPARSAWTDIGFLLGDDTSPGDNFGGALAIEGDLMVVGASRSNASGSLSGAAYIFRRSGPGIWTQEQKIVGSSVSAGSRFGFSVAIANGRVFVSAPFESHAAPQAGAVYVFELISPSWTECARVVASDPTTGALFGWDIDADQERLTVGATGSNTPGVGNSGAGYVYNHQAGLWTEQAKLVSSSLASGDAAGFQVALAGDEVMVAAPNNDTAGFDAGQVQHFSFISGAWLEQPPLYAPDAVGNDRFGWNLAFANDALLASSRGSLSPFVRPSEIYLFEPVGGEFAFAQDLGRRTKFPSAINGANTAGSGGRLAAAVFGTDVTTPFSRPTIERTLLNRDFDSSGLPSGVQESTSGLWQQTSSCEPGSCFNGERMYFGNATACNFDVGETSGLYTLTGIVTSADATHLSIAYRSYFDGEPGCTYDLPEVRINGLTIEQLCTGSVGSCDSRETVVDPAAFAQPLTISWSFDSVDSVANTGHGWSIDDIIIKEINTNAADCNANGIADECDIATDRSMDANGNGVPDECEDVVVNYCGPANSNSSGGPAQMDYAGSTSLNANDFVLRCTGAGINQFGYFIMSESQGFVPNFAGSQGDLCLAPPFIRFNRPSFGEILFTGLTGEAELSIDNETLPIMTTWLAGESWNFQFWFRDTNPILTSNTSDGLQVLFQP